MSDDRRKVWAAVLYEESAPSNWRDVLERTHVAIAVSPLHDKDVWSEDEDGHVAGEMKKPHWHIVFYFESLKSPNQVLGIAKELGLRYVEPVESPKAYNRYLCHLDNPNKARYSLDDVLRLNGAQCDMSKPKPTSDEQKAVRDEILSFIEQNGVSEYYELVMYAYHQGKEDWSWYIEHHTQYLNGLLKSKRHSGK